MKLRNNYLYNPLIGNFIGWFIAVAIMSLYVNGYVTHGGPMIIGLFVGSFWTINLHAYQEAYRIEVKHKDIPHGERFIIRFVIAQAASFLVHALAIGFKDGLGIAVLGGWLYIGSILWLLFDFMLNYHRGKPLLYVSSYYKTSQIDKFFSRFSPHVRCLLWVGSKVLLFLISVFIYHKSLQ